MDLRNLSMAKLIFIFSDPQFFSNAGTHFTDPYVQNIWELEGILEIVQPLHQPQFDEKTESCIHSMHIY